MSRYLLTIEYDGTGFHGWQRQEDLVTVQSVLEEALYSLSQENITLYVSGRTDAGVHAKAQRAHFDMKKKLSCHNILKGMNFYLQEQGVVVLDVKKVNDDFHARFDARQRQYSYYILNRKAPSALGRHRYWFIPYSLDVNAMEAAAQYLLGKHDFSAFRAQGCQSKSPVKTLSSIKIQKEGEIIKFTLVAPSFLYHQVRNIVGTLVQVGRGKWSPEYLQDVLQSCDRKKAGPTAPAAGLFFDHVSYK